MAWSGGIEVVSSQIKQSPEWFRRIGLGRDARLHPDELPIAGAYRFQYVKHGPWMPARILIIEHRHPVTKEHMADVEYLAEIGGESGIVKLGMTPDPALRPPRSTFELWDLWSLEVCTWDEHRHLVAMLNHALTREQDLAEANPRRPVNRLSQPTIF